jgi:uncharacterized protein YdhG (YjbR/CyaY superfamily)
MPIPAKQSAPKSIDEYIAAFSPDVQAILQQVRQVVHSAAPDAEEAISYQIPAFQLNGVLVYRVKQTTSVIGGSDG